MPRSAATLIGLILVGLSIGFNTVRYPVVWEMVGPAEAAPAAQPAGASQPAEAEGPSEPQPAAAPPAPPAEPIEVEPSKEVADNAVSADGNEAAVDEPEAQKPLVPVESVSSAGDAGIQRLPPIGRTDPNPPNGHPTVSLSGSIPVYPTTGIE